MRAFHLPYGTYPPHAAARFELSADTKRVRRFYEDFIPERCRPPTVLEMQAALGLTQDQLWEAMWQLHLAIQLFFLPGTENVIKMPPFAFYATRHLAKLADGRAFWTGCAGEACAFSFRFPGILITIESVCPDCWSPVTTVWRDGQLLSADPADAVIHIGLHPARWGENMLYACESMDFFRSADHAREWERAVPAHRGATLPISQAQAWIDGFEIPKQRYWNYDRGPEVVSPSHASRTIEALRAVGADVSGWE
jgi:hypothetical protein